MDIEKFNPGLAELQSLVAKTKELTITDFEDREQVQAVHKARMELRTARTNITKTGKELREDALNFQKKVIAKEKELVGIIEPEEDRLKALEEEAERFKERKAREALLPERWEKVKAIVGGDYPAFVARIKDLVEKGKVGSEPNLATDEYLLEMDAPTFQGYLNFLLTTKNVADSVELREREDAVKAEESRLAREKEEAAQKEREKQEAEARERRQAEEARERKVNERIERCRSLGLAWNDDHKSFVKEDFNVSLVEIQTDTDTEFAGKLEGIRAEMARRAVAKQEEERREREEAAARAERERLAKEERYQAFLKEHGYTEATTDDFYIYNDVLVGEVRLYKLVGTYKTDGV